MKVTSENVEMVEPNTQPQISGPHEPRVSGLPGCLINKVTPHKGHHSVWTKKHGPSENGRTLRWFYPQTPIASNRINRIATLQGLYPFFTLQVVGSNSNWLKFERSISLASELGFHIRCLLQASLPQGSKDRGLEERTGRKRHTLLGGRIQLEAKNNLQQIPKHT